MTYDTSLDKDQRANLKMFAIVNHACTIKDFRQAAIYLMEYDVPLHVTRRVLLQPHLRRK